METGTQVTDISSASPLPTEAGRPLTRATTDVPLVTTSTSEGLPSVRELVIRGTSTKSVTIVIDIAATKAKYENLVANSGPTSVETTSSHEG
jgi:hypothetical protein